MNKNFVILLPPPNISGNLHMGHALNFFLQDFLVRTNKIFFFSESFLLPGLDHGGISTEYSALKENKSLLSEKEKFKIINNFAENHKEIILQQMKKFNLLLDFSHLQYTLQKSHLDLVNESFVKLYNKGLIKEEERIVYWDSFFQTSLSSLEITYKNVNDKLYYIKYKIYNEDKFITVATTRPETIFGDVALAVNEKNIFLKNKKVFIPLTEKIIPIIFDDSVDENYGTGILKITPAHDENDFFLSKKHNLPFINLFENTPNGFILNENVPKEFQSLKILEARKKILEILKQNNLLEKEENIYHKVMFGEKSNERIETIVKNQWYLDLKKSSEKLLHLFTCGKINIFPSQWENTFKKWLENYQPWCISREIVWGHTMPVWRTKKTNKIIVAINEIEAKKQVPEEEIIQEKFLLDTWFSSGLWPLLYKKINKDFYPSSILVTAYDIIFFWVARMMMMSLELDESLPFSKILLHNLIRDEKGEKMSKTKGNGIDPLEIINLYGNTDILRYTLLSKISNRSQIYFSEKDLQNGKKLLNKILNAIKFLQINYKDFHLKENNFISHPLVIYFLNKLSFLKLEEKLFTDFQIYSYVHDLYNFFWHDYCDWFIECSKNQINDEEIKFGLIFILKKCLQYFHGLLPSFTENKFLELFNENIFNKNTTKYCLCKTENNIEELFTLIKLIRSWENFNVIKVFLSADTFNFFSEHLIYKALKIFIKEKNDEYMKYFYWRKKKIYFSDFNENKFIKYLEEKKKNLFYLFDKIENQNPPENLKKTFLKEIEILQEEISTLENLLKNK